MSIIKSVKSRWNSETPKFFKQIKKLAVTLGSSATAVWMINISMNLGLHETILEVCKYLIAGSAAMGLTAQLTKVDSSDENLDNQ